MPSFKWFQALPVSPGNEIQVHNRAWTVLKQYDEFSAQMHDDSLGISYASVELECSSDTTTAFMRIYMQIPLIGTEFISPVERAKQANTLEPSELEALKHLTAMGSRITPRLLDYSIQKQDINGLVPGGALIFLISENLRGEYLGAGAFWALKKHERDKIRTILPQKYEELCSYGYHPRFANTSNLVWDANTGNLYFVGFERCYKLELSSPEDGKWRPSLWACWGVAKPPKDSNFHSRNWDGNMSGWEL